MGYLKTLYNIENILFSVLGYQISYIEFVGTICGLLCVWLAVKSNIHTWTVGIINIVCFFMIYYQVQLYSDMLLQVFFFFSSLFGIYMWSTKSRINKEVSRTKNIVPILIGMIIFTILLGVFASKVHVIMPTIFSEPAAFPFIDALTTVLSICATYLMIYKKVECWYMWITVDVICIILYIQRGLFFISLEFFVFLLIATWGLIKWHKLLNNETRISTR